MEKYNFLNKSAKGPTRIGQANESVLRTRKKPAMCTRYAKLYETICVFPTIGFANFNEET